MFRNMFAQFDLSAPPVGVAAWIGCFAFIVVLINAVIKLADRLRGKQPYPPNEILEKRVNGVEETMNEIESRVERHREANDRAAQVRTAGIYTKVDQVRKESQEHTEAVRKELSDKIDGLPDRLIATLKNTGALRR